MINEKLRKALYNMCEELELGEGEQPIILDNHAYDNSIVGITEGNNIVYSYQKMVEELMDDEGWSVEEAAEWLDCNTLRAIPYIASAGPVPIVLCDDVESILEKYGE